MIEFVFYALLFWFVLGIIDTFFRRAKEVDRPRNVTDVSITKLEKRDD